jgi:hypothetical protein
MCVCTRPGLGGAARWKRRLGTSLDPSLTVDLNALVYGTPACVSAAATAQEGAQVREGRPHHTYALFVATQYAHLHTISPSHSPECAHVHIPCRVVPCIHVCVFVVFVGEALCTCVCLHVCVCPQGAFLNGFSHQGENQAAGGDMSDSDSEGEFFVRKDRGRRASVSAQALGCDGE